MALLVTKENRPIFVTAEQARLLWLVSTGERKGTPKTREKARQIKKWYLNRQTAPKSWKDKHPLFPERRINKNITQVPLPYKD
jgi:hypothetical protein